MEGFESDLFPVSVENFKPQNFLPKLSQEEKKNTETPSENQRLGEIFCS